MIPHYTSKNFRDALLNLLPMGPIWSREEGGMIWVWATIIGKSYERNSDRAIDLLKVSFPATATELITEWENTVGLPDSCVGPVEDISVRQMLVVDRLVSSVESSIEFYIEYAKKYFGINIIIDQYSPFRFGTSFNKPFGYEEWSHTWRIRSDQELGFLHCIFSRIAPAHTWILFGPYVNEL
ncbi:putative phage tail protein [Commensalibacter papalotli (ex Botero et al. 2024)]|uniref:putative phage tail protein n=1 Tax=Commensalibacter papalotli (ex Botero et al. 2024) TaxID=2972766 RepID=UPI0022FF80F3|nr:putative phage tail protein [Commensalibacter papalotli (ex Botero et al. 2024)]CAI3945707.1 DUF2313 family (YmfQ) [Commensalibacter papalotli (ex Botero et al. 2024)]